MPQTEWLRNNKNLFSTIWRLESPKVLAWMHSGEAIFLGHTQCFVVFSCSGKGKESLWNFFDKGNCIHDDSALRIELPSKRSTF